MYQALLYQDDNPEILKEGDYTECLAALVAAGQKSYHPGAEIELRQLPRQTEVKKCETIYRGMRYRQ